MEGQLRQLRKQIKEAKTTQPFLIVGPEKTGKFSSVINTIGNVNNLTDRELEFVKKGKFPDIILVETEAEQSLVDQNNKLKNNNKEKSIKKETKNSKKKKPKDEITKEQIEKALENINLKNFQLSKKVLIIKSANKLNVTTANRLLKLLEEPNNNLLIFLIINNEDAILSTIKSRCQIIRFSLLSDEEIKNILRNEFKISKENISEVTKFARGRIELARDFINNPAKLKIAQNIQDDFREALKGGILEAFNLVEKITKNNNNDILWFLNEWIWYLKIFLEKNIANGQSYSVIKKVYFILDYLLQTRESIKASNAKSKTQLENFFVQIQ